MSKKVLALLAVLGIGLVAASYADAASAKQKAQIERGRYIALTSGCNDCHTPMFAMKEGKVDEKDWLVGDAVGWMGPWGTTYPKNLRALAGAMTEQEWVAYGKTLKTRPPMPYWAMNAMSSDDLKSLYHFLKALGASDNQVPAALPPGQIPATPYIDMNVVMPNKS